LFVWSKKKDVATQKSGYGDKHPMSRQEDDSVPYSTHDKASLHKFSLAENISYLTFSDKMFFFHKKN
jgi:hypothetical protein